MKKLLMIGAILVMGTLGYAAQTTELDPTAGTGKTSLALKTTGNVVSAASKVMLIITPTRSAGPNGDSLDFNFGTLTEGQSNTLIGKFTAEVITGDTKREYGILTSDNLSVQLMKGTDKKNSFDNQVKNSNGDTIATVSYTLTDASRITNSGKTYEGEIEATAIPNTNGHTGLFVDRELNVNVKVTSIKMEVSKS
jgi:hypothetical protein